MPQSCQSFNCSSVIVVFSLPNFPFMFSGHQSGSDDCVCHCTLGLPVRPLCWLWGDHGFWTHLSVWSPNTVCSTFILCNKKKNPHKVAACGRDSDCRHFLPRFHRAGAVICYSATNTWWHCGIITLEDWGARLSDNLALAGLFTAAFRSLTSGDCERSKRCRVNQRLSGCCSVPNSECNIMSSIVVLHQLLLYTFSVILTLWSTVCWIWCCI